MYIVTGKLPPWHPMVVADVTHGLDEVVDSIKEEGRRGRKPTTKK
jgi:hypothetical protein